MTPYTTKPYDLCAELTPDKMVSYLIANGYEQTMADVYVSLYRRPNDGLMDAVEVPLDPTLRDYGRRMYEALQDLDGAFLGLLHKIDPVKFPTERILVLAGVTV